MIKDKVVEILMTRINLKREIIDQLNVEFKQIDDTYYLQNEVRAQKFLPNRFGQWITIEGKKWYKDSTLNYGLLNKPKKEEFTQ
ncbi:hypothetical protein [Gillisia sp. Hel_I_29]|uniref:hypothetical protein n=1 Tax=Gillisia sp. Hel_I_29 TaxID=1249975 RepID=UPI00054EB54F|nr:hypothetical protein [Gillisia sp. Hel_I_29]